MMKPSLLSNAALEKAIDLLKKQSYVRFEAICKQKNIFRFYEIYLTKDLFNRECLLTSFGRLSTHGTQKAYSFETSDDLSQKLKQIISKRLKSTKRIGVNYTLV